MTKFEVKLHRYTDQDRKSLARRAAIFKGKSDRDNVKRPLQFVAYGHMSIFRGETISVELYTKKAVYDHLVTYTTIAGRYCAGLRANEAVEVDAGELQETAERILAEYQAAIQGIDPETAGPAQKKRLENARDIAPISVMVRYDLEINFLTLVHIFKDRQWIAGFQKETGDVIAELWKLVHAQDPELWDTIHEYHGPHVHRWTNALHNVRGYSLNGYLKGLPKAPVTIGMFIEELVGERAVELVEGYGIDPTIELETFITDKYCRMPKVW